MNAKSALIKLLIFIGLIVIIVIGVMPRNRQTNNEFVDSEVYGAVVPTNLRSANMVSAGYNHTLAVDANSVLWAWGQNENGQLGTGNNRPRRLPIKIMDDITFAVGGSGHTLAIDKNGAVWGWGQGNFNQNGNTGITSNFTLLSLIPAFTDIADTNKPSKIMDGVIYAAAGTSHSAAIKSDGSLWTWGAMGGKGSDPKYIMDDVISATAGDHFSVALKKDGSVWAWGINRYGQVGDGTTERRSEPVKVNINDVVAIASGDSHTLALKSDGSVWGWGLNESYSTGDRSKAQNSPVHIMDNIVSVAAGAHQSFAIDTSGNLWSWGDNGSVKRYTPESVMSGVSSVSAGKTHAIVIRTDRSVITWGKNEYGQLGNAAEDVLDGSAVIGDGLDLFMKIVELSLLVPLAIFGMAASIFPSSGSGEASIMAALIFIVLYLAGVFFYYRFVKKREIAFITSGYEKYGFNILPFWHWLFYIAAILIIPMTNYFEWPRVAIFAMIPLIGIPQLYLLIRVKTINYPDILLKQFIMAILYAIGFGMFTVVVLVIYLIFLSTLFGAGMRGAMKDVRKGSGGYVCPNCGAQSSTGGVCPHCG